MLLNTPDYVPSEPDAEVPSDSPVEYEEDPVVTMVHQVWISSIDEAKEWLENVKLDHAYGGVDVKYWTHDEHIADAQKLVDDLTATFGKTYGIQSQ